MTTIGKVNMSKIMIVESNPLRCGIWDRTLHHYRTFTSDRIVTKSNGVTDLMKRCFLPVNSFVVVAI